MMTKKGVWVDSKTKIMAGDKVRLQHGKFTETGQRLEDLYPARFFRKYGEVYRINRATGEVLVGYGNCSVSWKPEWLYARSDNERQKVLTFTLMGDDRIHQMAFRGKTFAEAEEVVRRKYRNIGELLSYHYEKR